MPEYSTKILGGFPVTISYSPTSAEPDVGIMSPGIEINDIFNGKGKSIIKWISPRISEGEWDRLFEEIWHWHYN